MDNPPFIPDKNPKKKAVAGKSGYGKSVAAHLAQMAMKKAAEKKLKEAANYVDEVRDPSMAGVKVGEKVRLTNPKAPPKHTLDKIKGNTAFITKGDGSKMTLPLDRIKRVKAQSMKEEVEEIEELKKQTLGSYINKAAIDLTRSGHTLGMTKHFDRTQNQNRKSIGTEITVKHIDKRLDGIKAATKKLSKEEVEHLDEAGYRPEHITIHSPGHRLHGKQARVFHRFDDGRINVQVDNSMKRGDVSNYTLNKGQYKEKTNEEVGHLDESVKVAKAAAAEAHAKDMSSTAAENHILDAVISAHKGKSEGAGGGVTRAKINNATDVGVAHFNKLRGMKEEREMRTLRDIVEGRGRPRKNPDDPKWKKMEAKPKSKEDDDEEEDSGPARPGSPHLATEPDKHISVQLKVAQDMKDEKGGADVKFSNGKTHFVPHDVAGKVLNALDKVKPAQRAELHDHIAQSHDNLMAVHKLVS